MKVSVLTLLATAVLASARVVPQACDRSTADVAEHDITTDTTAICLLPCWPRPRKCPKGWYPKKFGNCWTCCKRPHHSHAFSFEEEEFEGIDELD